VAAGRTADGVTNNYKEKVMKSAKLTCITGIALFTLLGIPVWLAAQEQLASQTNPVPFINQPLVPDAVAPGGAGFKLTVNGTGFVSTSVVKWNGSKRTTIFVNRSQLTATILASDIAKTGTASVTVVNPSPGGGTSNVAFLPVATSIPAVVMTLSDLAIPPYPWGLTTADLNGDGKLDLAIPNINYNTLYVLLGNGDGTFQSAVDYDTGNGPQIPATGDFNSDGILDLVVCNRYAATVSILLGNGDGTFQPHVDYQAGKISADHVAVGDFNGDGKLDLVVANVMDDTISVLLGNGDGTFQSPVAYSTGSGTAPGWTSVGDVNGDGNLDLAVTDTATSKVAIFLGNGNGTFQPPVDYVAGGAYGANTLADFNGDGKLDLAAANYTNSTIDILLGNGDGTFGKPTSYKEGTNDNPTIITAADFNGDGKLDLAASNLGSGTVSLLLGNGDGTFRKPTQYVAGGGRQIVAGDFNGDGRLDLGVTGSDGNYGATVLWQATTVTLSPPSLKFGVQLIGSRSAEKKVTLTNTGQIPLSLNSIAITGGQDFDEHNNCGSSLPPKAHCTIRVTFKPTGVGPQNAALTVTDNGVGSPQSVPLSGTGVTSGPNATLSTKNLIFPLQLVGTSSSAQPVKLSNYGTETLDITSIVASGDFSKKDDCGSNLPPEGSCNINVTFTPTQRGHRNGTVTITDNAPDSPQKVSLKGTATIVKLDPASLDFGTVTVGQKSSPQNTTLTSVGKTRLHITDITITGTDSGDFSEQNNCPDPGYLGAGKSCTITVTFQPTQAGSRSADVSVTDNGGGSPQQVSLSGMGQSACGGRCGFGGQCPTGCRCAFGFCLAASSAVVEETASRQACSQTNRFTELR
jgi:hypothetical protein